MNVIIGKYFLLLSNVKVESLILDTKESYANINRKLRNAIERRNRTQPLSHTATCWSLFCGASNDSNATKNTRKQACACDAFCFNCYRGSLQKGMLGSSQVYRVELIYAQKNVFKSKYAASMFNYVRVCLGNGM